MKNHHENRFCPSREEFCRVCRLLYERRLASGTGGNISARRGQRIFLTPTGSSLREIRPQTVSVTNGEGVLLGGDSPTKEVNLHLKLLGQRPDINVVFHLHGPHIIAASTLLKPGPSTLPALTPAFVYHAHPLPMIPFMVPGTEALAEAVAQSLRHGASRAVLLKNHGLIAVGRDFDEAMNIAEEIDEAARVFLLAGEMADSIPAPEIDQIKSLRGR